MIISSTWNKFGNLRPFVAVYTVVLDDRPILLLRPLVLLDIRIQVIVPSLTTLLSNPPWECLSDVAPVFGTELLNIFS